MRIMLTKPLPQLELGKVIPAGVIIDAPAGLSERLLRENRGKPVQTADEAAAAVATAPKSKLARKKVRKDG